MSRQERRRIERIEAKKLKKARREAQKKLKEKQLLEGFRIKKKNAISNSKCSHQTIEEENNADHEAVISFLKTVKRLLPGLLKRLSKVKDFRCPNKLRHKVDIILLLSLLSFVFQKASRRAANRDMTTPTFIENLRKFIPDLEALPHHDTINRFLSGIDINELEKIAIDYIKDFIRSKKFVNYLINRCYPIAIDGTQKYKYDFLWAEECQRRKINGKEQYYCYCLEAILAFHNGLTIPLGTEFLDYMEGDVSSKKQDCELKAFKRLAKKIKDFFPKLKIMVLLDGLYPNGYIMDICRKYRWDYMIVLQDGSLKSGVWSEFKALKDLEENNKVKQVWGNRHQKFTWVNDISYEYDKGKIQIVHVVVCEEQWDEVSEDGSIERKHSKHAWISEKRLNRYNLHERCNLGARHRWGIESSILVEKQYGYEYEHAFSFNWNAMKGYHLLMRMAHMINALAQYGSLTKYLFSKAGVQAAIKNLDEIFRRVVLDGKRIMKSLAEPYQIRFG